MNNGYTELAKMLKNLNKGETYGPVFGRITQLPDLIITRSNNIQLTQKGRYKIYNGTSYGTRIKDTFVGKTFTHDYMLSEIQREITENLEKNKDIVSVDGFRQK